MMTILHGGDRPTILGIPLKPIMLWGVLSMAIVAQANLRNEDRNVQYPLSTVVGVLAAISLTICLIALIQRSHRLTQVALLMIVLVYATRTAFIWLTNGIGEQAGWFGLAVVVLAGSAYLMEKVDESVRRAGG